MKNVYQWNVSGHTLDNPHVETLQNYLNRKSNVFNESDARKYLFYWVNTREAHLKWFIGTPEQWEQYKHIKPYIVDIHSFKAQYKDWYEGLEARDWMIEGLMNAHGINLNKATNDIRRALDNIIFYKNKLDSEITDTTKSVLGMAYNGMTDKQKKVIDDFVEQSKALGMQTFAPDTGIPINPAVDPHVLDGTDTLAHEIESVGGR